MARWWRGAVCFFCALALGQTTQGLLAGRIRDLRTAEPIPQATVRYWNLSSGWSGETDSREGRYAILLLPPGEYRVRVTAPGYQGQELTNLRVGIAARLDLDFALRKRGEPWTSPPKLSPGAGTVVTFFGPDVDQVRLGRYRPNPGRAGALEAALSNVVPRERMLALPLAGRDAYTLLVAEAGVAVDSGTARGLGVSVMGQRPSSAQFLLDGMENNDTLVTGPLSGVAPEALEEYRLSTSSFTPEFGRTAGFVANAEVRRGGTSWHGLSYLYARDEIFDANPFNRNRLGLPRSPFSEWQGGGQLGGPLRKDRLSASLAFETLHTRGFADPQSYTLPSSSFPRFTSPASLARQLFERFPAVTKPDSTAPLGTAVLSPPAAQDRQLGLLRVDWRSEKIRVMLRYAANAYWNPKFIWTPYPDFVSGLARGSHAVALRTEQTLGAARVNEFRTSVQRQALDWARARPDVPTLADLGTGAALPGSPAFYGFDNRATSWEFGDNFSLATGSHIAKFGGSWYSRAPGGALSAGRDGLVAFADVLDFTLDAPSQYVVALDRSSSEYRSPDYERRWRLNQAAFFAQDTWRVNDQWVLNFGLRYDSFGAPKDRRTATLLWQPDRQGWQPRFGVSFAPRPGRPLLVRGAWGLFRDNLFDNLWQNVRNNGWLLASFPLDANRSRDYLQPVPAQLSSLAGQPFLSGFPRPTRLDARLRNGVVQQMFIGLQWSPVATLTLEANGMATLGRDLVTTDWVGREAPLASQSTLRSSLGRSQYTGLAVLTRWRHRLGYVEGSYTWSRAIDIQSEPLAGDFFDLSFVRATQTSTSRQVAQFDREGHWRAERGNADFDQRHNFVLSSTWTWKGFRFSTLSAVRSGFPYSVFAGGRRAVLRRADVLTQRDVPGGRLLLDRSGFRAADPNETVNQGRNSFRAPSLFNMDASVGRDFALSERLRLTVRADIYNVTNQANLSLPETQLSSPQFGIATYGYRGRASGFPAAVPFRETPRQIQLLLRLEF